MMSTSLSSHLLDSSDELVAALVKIAIKAVMEDHGMEVDDEDSNIIQQKNFDMLHFVFGLYPRETSNVISKLQPDTTSKGVNEEIEKAKATYVRQNDIKLNNNKALTTLTGNKTSVNKETATSDDGSRSGSEVEDEERTKMPTEQLMLDGCLHEGAAGLETSPQADPQHPGAQVLPNHRESGELQSRDDKIPEDEADALVPQPSVDIRRNGETKPAMNNPPLQSKIESPSPQSEKNGDAVAMLQSVIVALSIAWGAFTLYSYFHCWLVLFVLLWVLDRKTHHNSAAEPIAALSKPDQKIGGDISACQEEEAKEQYTTMKHNPFFCQTPGSVIAKEIPASNTFKITFGFEEKMEQHFPENQQENETGLLTRETGIYKHFGTWSAPSAVLVVCTYVFGCHRYMEHQQMWMMAFRREGEKQLDTQRKIEEDKQLDTQRKTEETPLAATDKTKGVGFNIADMSPRQTEVKQKPEGIRTKDGDTETGDGGIKTITTCSQAQAVKRQPEIIHAKSTYTDADQAMNIFDQINTVLTWMFMLMVIVRAAARSNPESRNTGQHHVDVEGEDHDDVLHSGKAGETIGKKVNILFDEQLHGTEAKGTDEETWPCIDGGEDSNSNNNTSNNSNNKREQAEQNNTGNVHGGNGTNGMCVCSEGSATGSSGGAGDDDDDDNNGRKDKNTNSDKLNNTDGQDDDDDDGDGNDIDDDKENDSNQESDEGGKHELCLSTQSRATIQTARLLSVSCQSPFCAIPSFPMFHTNHLILMILQQINWHQNTEFAPNILQFITRYWTCLQTPELLQRNRLSQQIGMLIYDHSREATDQAEFAQQRPFASDGTASHTQLTTRVMSAGTAMTFVFRLLCSRVDGAEYSAVCLLLRCVVEQGHFVFINAIMTWSPETGPQVFSVLMNQSGSSPTERSSTMMQPLGTFHSFQGTWPLNFLTRLQRSCCTTTDGQQSMVGFATAFASGDQLFQDLLTLPDNFSAELLLRLTGRLNPFVSGGGVITVQSGRGGTRMDLLPLSGNREARFGNFERGMLQEMWRIISNVHRGETTVGQQLQSRNGPFGRLPVEGVAMVTAGVGVPVEGVAMVTAGADGHTNWLSQGGNSSLEQRSGSASGGQRTMDSRRMQRSLASLRAAAGKTGGQTVSAMPNCGSPGSFSQQTEAVPGPSHASGSDEGDLDFTSSGEEQDMRNVPPDPSPVDPSPVDPSPVDPSPVDPSPVDPSPVDPSPVDPSPVDPSPVDPSPDPSPDSLKASAVGGCDDVGFPVQCEEDLSRERQSLGEEGGGGNPAAAASPPLSAPVRFTIRNCMLVAVCEEDSAEARLRRLEEENKRLLRFYLCRHCWMKMFEMLCMPCEHFVCIDCMYQTWDWCPVCFWRVHEAVPVRFY